MKNSFLEYFNAFSYYDVLSFLKVKMKNLIFLPQKAEKRKKETENANANEKGKKRNSPARD